LILEYRMSVNSVDTDVLRGPIKTN
jgi:hypothetical protein